MSPADYLNHDANLTSFKKLATWSTQNFIYKRMTAPRTQPTRMVFEHEIGTHPTAHPSLIHLLLRKFDLYLPDNTSLETIYPYPTPPWQTHQETVINEGEKREAIQKRIFNQLTEEKNKGACAIFTDGSYLPGKGRGAAAVAETVTLNQAYGPETGISNYETKVMGLIIALIKFRDTIIRHSTAFTSLAIFSDNQAALSLLTKPLQPKSL
ncbi:hypothetical protein CROQUDRAFT_654653 [Cronartium quercuum f. sp. fusiforme G11]|uniref:RNase H type-1 domain-containing protein n=1 Tax=Cronartium quercuum f. sp. fusiforme G11 TaxID=708437 RepID=A0A9P6NN30_9BASI|nr:hypothetical protein CROQUDRAFT_654653 [Cronartium quercuum f. sp. fusiforme G11]